MDQAVEQRVYNFSAGPATLPLAALEEAQRNLLAYPGAGASIMEISHRSKTFTEVIEKAEANIRALLGMPDGYQVLFLQGGASMQFAMAPLNLLHEGASADYIVTGSWGVKALKEAQKVGTAKCVWDGKGENFVRTPAQSELDLDPKAAYCHITSNETIQGVVWPELPDTGDVPIVCDASSDFLSKPTDVSKYGILYAGAQKNIGPAGVACVIIREDLLDRCKADLPSLLHYPTLAEANSLFNTPPTFAIYMVMLVTDWVLQEIGGLEKMEAINRRKAAMLYDTIDTYGEFYQGHARPECRSIMNVAFRLPSDELTAEFIERAKSRGLDALKGHRSVGGCRASIYNAMPVEGVEALRDFMVEFAKEKG